MTVVPLLVLLAVPLADAPSLPPEGVPVVAIRIEGLSTTREKVVLRELVSRVGEPFERGNLVEDRERLDRLRIFSAIDVAAVSGRDGAEIVITVRETLPYLPSLSLQVNDENGLSIGPGLKSVNFLGRAIQLDASARFGGATNVELFVRDPFIAGNHLSYQLQLIRRDRDNVLDDFGELSHELEARFGSFVRDHGRLGAVAAFMRLGADRDGLTLSETNRDEVPAVGGYVGYDSRDLWSNPHRGFWSELQISKSGGALGGPADFWTFVLDFRRYQPVGRGRTLALTSLTTLQTGEVGAEIPIYLDYHVGGTNTIRGWKLGSREGKNQFVNTIELRQALMPARPVSLWRVTAYFGLEVAGFVDFGQAWSRPEQFALNEFIAGYGVGLRLLVPFVDVVRLDVAFGQPAEGPTVHFGIYPKVEMQRNRVR